MAGSVPTAYLVATARAPDYLRAIQRGTAPTRFTTQFLENLGFKNKADRRLIPLLKAIRFLDESNVPTQAYRDYLDEKRGRVVLGRQILGAYEGLFELDRQAHKAEPADLKGKFKSLTNASDNVANLMALTFKGLCEEADIELARAGPESTEPPPVKPPRKSGEHEVAKVPEEVRRLAEVPPLPVGLSYRIEINLPNTTDVEVYRAIFRALREHLTG